MFVDEIVRRIQEALPQTIVETHTAKGMIIVVVDGKNAVHFYPDAEYLEDSVERTIEEIKRMLS